MFFFNKTTQINKISLSFVCGDAKVWAKQGRLSANTPQPRPGTRPPGAGDLSRHCDASTVENRVGCSGPNRFCAVEALFLGERSCGRPEVIFAAGQALGDVAYGDVILDAAATRRGMGGGHNDQKQAKNAQKETVALSFSPPGDGLTGQRNDAASEVSASLSRLLYRGNGSWSFSLSPPCPCAKNCNPDRPRDARVFCPVFQKISSWIAPFLRIIVTKHITPGCYIDTFTPRARFMRCLSPGSSPTNPVTTPVYLRPRRQTLFINA